MFPVIFLEEAEAEFEEAQAWYEERSRGLGQAFVTSVQASIERVRRSPLQFPVVDGDVRRALTRRFPYGVFYLSEEHRVVVVAVFHSSRDPRERTSRV
jgi:plasmid stabilization system protein ParE